MIISFYLTHLILHRDMNKNFIIKNNTIKQYLLRKKWNE